MFKIIVLWLVSMSALAAPFIVSDPTPQIVTHCGIVVDSAAKVDSPVVTDTTGSYCKFNIGTVAVGVHTVKATFVNIDPAWGRSESAASAPFTFTRPGSSTLTAPGTLVLSPL